ncbi:MAG: ABC transporter ATP-binding protein [Peptostreptococcaceae bacterium]|nr:ABC transporter ATP-binding protein [Peptostreptococcaceae bacterium]
MFKIIISIKNMSKMYNSHKVFNDFSLDIKRGEIFGLLGSSGCGKSTLLNIISNTLDIDEGIILNSSKKTSYVFQENRLLPWKTLYENISIVNEQNPKEDVLKIIDSMGLYKFKDNYPHELSGGMKKRCSIGRAFNYDADLMLMDEPFKSLDYKLKIDMIKSLLKLWDKNKLSIVFVTHEIEEALLLCDRVAVLSKDSSNKILNIFKIDEKRSNRKLNDKYLTDMRNEIIEFLIN